MVQSSYDCKSNQFKLGLGLGLWPLFHKAHQCFLFSPQPQRRKNEHLSLPLSLTLCLVAEKSYRNKQNQPLSLIYILIYFLKNFPFGFLALSVGFMAPSKAPKKQQKRGIDFKVRKLINELSFGLIFIQSSVKVQCLIAFMVSCRK